jgi:hypothetical protein
MTNGESHNSNGKTQPTRKKLLNSALKSKPKFSLPGFLGALLGEVGGEKGLAEKWADTYHCAEPGGNTRKSLLEMAMRAMIQAHESMPTDDPAIEDLEAEVESLLAQQ